MMHAGLLRKHSSDRGRLGGGTGDKTGAGEGGKRGSLGGRGGSDGGLWVPATGFSGYPLVGLADENKAAVALEATQEWSLLARNTVAEGCLAVMEWLMELKGV